MLSGYFDIKVLGPEGQNFSSANSSVGCGFKLSTVTTYFTRQGEYLGERPCFSHPIMSCCLIIVVGHCLRRRSRSSSRLHRYLSGWLELCDSALFSFPDKTSFGGFGCLDDRL